MEFVIGIAIAIAMAIVNLIKRLMPEGVVPLLSFVLSLIVAVPLTYLFSVDLLTGLQQVAISAALILGLFASTDYGVKSFTGGRST